MKRLFRLSKSALFLFLACFFVGLAMADHFDNQTPEERPRKKKPLTKYEKSEYISTTPEIGKPYYYTEDGDMIDHNAKHKKGKHKHHKHDAESASADTPQPKKHFKKVSFSEPERPKATPTYPTGAKPSDYPTGAKPSDYPTGAKPSDYPTGAKPSDYPGGAPTPDVKVMP